jgi:hypothetical protein
MFGKLISRLSEKKSKSDHPLGSDANVDALLADIPQSDPARVLLDVDHWLAIIEAQVSEIGRLSATQALLRLDQFSWAATGVLLTRYLTAGSREYLVDSVWSMLDDHAGHLFSCHVAAINANSNANPNANSAADSEADRARMARCAVRAMRVWSLRKKLQRLRYRTPTPALWQEAHELMRLLARTTLLQVRSAAYRDEPESTPLAEYLIGLYLEMVPFGNMVPQQLEFVDAFLREAGTLELTPQAHNLSTHCIDLAAAAGPRRLSESEVVASEPGNASSNAAGASVRYCSTARLRAGLMRFAGQFRSADTVPSWVTRLTASQDQIQGVLMTLALHWAPTPPQRSSDRVRLESALKAVFGFDLVRRMIAYSHFARSGRALDYDGLDVNHWFEAARFGRVDAAEAATPTVADEAERPVLSPLEVLQKLELAGDRAQMDNWQQLDNSGTGIGTVVPAILARHRIGALVGLRQSDGLDWRMGIIRRIGRDAANRPGIGIEILPSPSICAQAKPVGETGQWARIAGAAYEWYDAILASHDSNQIMLAAGAFGAGLEIVVRSHCGLWHLRLESLLDRGTDYDRIEFTRLS